MMGLAGGISPYFLFGSKGGGNSSFACGYFYDARAGDPEYPVRPRQGMVAGGSWQARPWASLGASVRSVGTGAGVGLEGFGIDEDAGALLTPWRALRLGLAIRNLQESGAGQVPEGFRTRRSYLLSGGAGLERVDLLGLTFHDPDAYYEFRSVGPPPDGRMVHAFSAAAGFMPEGRLAFRGTFLLPQSGTPGYALGTFLNLPLGRRGALLFGYTFQTGGPQATGEADASHSISLRFRLGAKPVALPLTVELRADKAYAAPRDSATPAQLDFRLSVIDKTHSHASGENDLQAAEPFPAGAEGYRPAGPEAKPLRESARALSEGRIREWLLTIHAVGKDGVAGAEVKTYRGRDLPPKVIRWLALDETGKRIPPGFYCFRLEATDADGNHGNTAWQMVEIGTDPDAPAK